MLSDAGPGAWGVHLRSKILTRENKPLPSNPVEWLLASWHYGSGCLGFSPHHTEPPGLGITPGRIEELSGKLAQAIGRLAVDDDVVLTDADIRLMGPGGSLGGVRPKTVVMHDGLEHIAKFSRPDDIFDVPAVEYATMRLAHDAGIETPGFELITTHPQSIGVCALGAASTSANALSQCGRFLLKRDEAVAIVESVRAVVAGWRQSYTDAGVAKRDLALLDSCISPTR